MMPQMEPGQPIRPESSANYGRYEGNQANYPPPQYEVPPYNAEPQGNIYDDDYVDMLAQRLSQRMASGPASKIQPTPSGRHKTASDGMRLALAIVSVGVLVPLAAILMGGVGGLSGLITFGAACLAIFLINAILRKPDGMRLALAIVSVAVLVPLAAILMGGVGGLVGFIAFIAACLAIFLINATYNNFFQ